MERLAIILGLLCISSCASGELDRESARAALVRAVGENGSDIRAISVWWFIRKSEIPHLEEIGFVNGNMNTPLLNKYAFFLGDWDAMFTSSQENDLPAYFQDYLLVNPKLMNVKEAPLEFQVTGVSLVSGSQAEVIFTWKKAPLPEFWDSVIIGEGEGHAVAQKFDDGWRIMKVEFTAARARKLRNRELESFHREVVAKCALSASEDWPWGQADYMERSSWNEPAKLTLAEGRISPGCQ